jgi:hypothetical protein
MISVSVKELNKALAAEGFRVLLPEHPAGRISK